METSIDSNTLATGYLDVDSGHRLFWEEWGNPNGAPIMSLHGGPGSGFSDSHKTIFDPRTHHVFFHDQRGSGRSEPLGETNANTTQHLIADISKLADHHNLDTFNVAGGSWGSTLALAYAIAEPSRVQNLLIWSIYLGSHFETDWVNEGYPRHHFPEAWDRFISHVPEEHRGSGTKTMQYYADKIHGNDEALAHQYALEWSLWEATLMSLQYDKEALETAIQSDEELLPGAKLETHYFLNDVFLEEDHIMNNLNVISGIRCAIVQGRFDMCTPPQTAIALAKAYGDKASIQVVNSGHRRTDAELRVALQATARSLFA